MALPPTWVSIAISEVEDGDDPHVIARAICDSPRVINSIRTGISEFYEMEQRNKQDEARNGRGPICGAPSKAEMIRAKFIEAIESTEY